MNNEEVLKIIEETEYLPNIKVKDYCMPGVSGDKLEEAFVGYRENLDQFISDMSEELEDEVYYSQDYTVPYHEGKFIDLYGQVSGVDYVFTIYYYELIEDRENMDYSIFIYGLYNKREV